MKRFFFSAAIVMAAVLSSHAQMRVSYDVIIGKRQPNRAEQRAMQAEEAANPQVTTSMREIRSSIAAVERAPSNFDGRKAQAIADMRTAYYELRKALFYRLYQDQGR